MTMTATTKNALDPLQRAEGNTTTPKGSSAMNTQQSTVTRYTKPDWATDVEELGDAAHAVNWVRDVGADAHLDVDLIQFQDDEGTDAPVLRIWVDGTLLDLRMPVSDAAEIGLGLMIAAFTAANALAGTAHELVVGEDLDGSPLPYAELTLPSALPAGAVVSDHFVSRQDGSKAVKVHPAMANDDMSIDDARRYILEVANVIAVAKGVA